MKRIFIIVFLSIATLLLAQNKYQNQYYFYENKGQIIDQKAKPNPEVKYLFNSAGLNVQIKKNGFSYDVYEVEKKVSKKKQATSENTINPKLQKKQNQNVEYTSKYHRVDINLVNANNNVQIEAEGKSQDYENYYNLEHNPKGVENVHRYQRIVYKNVYNNVDLVFFKPEDSTKTVEYNFLVHPGGKVSDIKMKFEGAKTKLKDGKLAMALRFGEMQENIPNSWIEHSNSKQNIAVNFKDFGNQTFGFDSEINTSDKTIVIDPVPTRIWGSFFGGDNEDIGLIRTDNNDDVYVYGNTWSSINIATTGAYQTTFNTSGYRDAFLAKISKDGSQKLWGTYYGMKYYDDFMQVTFDNQNNVFATGQIHIPSPTSPNNPYSANIQMSLVKFSPTGTMIYNNIYGGNGEEEPWDIAYLNNNIYVIGNTSSTADFATAGAFQSSVTGGRNGFVAKFDSNSGNKDWITYYAGSGATSLYKIFNVDNDTIEIIGRTAGTTLPLKNPIRSSNNGGGSDGVYIIFDEIGDLKYGTFLGEDVKNEYLQSARRIGDEVYISAEQYINSTSEKGLLYRINTKTNSIVSSKLFDLYDTLQNITYIDEQANIFVSGSTTHLGTIDYTGVSTPGAFLENPPSSQNVFVVKYDSDLNKIWGTFYYGSQVNDVIKDKSGNLYFYGMVSGNIPNIATPGAFQQNNLNTSNSIYIAKFIDCSSSATASSNSPICIGSNIELKASGGTNYSWTGPNGFTSSLQNPIITNATTANSGVYSCAITGSGGCDGTYTVTVFVGDNEKPIPDDPNLPKLTGDCNFVVTTIPTATDKCAGKITATTTDPLSYSLPGLYTITWHYTDRNGNTEIQTQLVEITDQPKPTGSQQQNFCAIDHPEISDIQVVGTNLKWYNASGLILPVNTALVDNTTYYVTQNSAGCESSKLEILVNVSDPVAPSGNSPQSFCIGQNPTLGDIAITGQNIKWYNASNILLAQTTPLVDGETYYATQTISSCESINKLAVKVAVNNSSISASNYVEPTFCNDTTDDFKLINLNDYRTKLITNITGLQFTFYDSNNQLVPDFTKAKLNIGHNLFNVEIKNTVGCSQWFTLEFNLNKKPKLSLPSEVEFCSGIDAELNAGDCAGCTFLWNTGETSQIIKTQTEGTYTVTVTTEKTCQNSASVVVKKAKLATIKNIQIENNLVTITMSEAGDYLYSDDNINWQTSNQFKLENGNYTIYVKTKMGCLIDQRTISIFEIPNSFSPNADGINDTWKIKGLENYKDSQVIVLDRFGKKLFETKVNGIFEWNGKINGHPLPTDTYWYIINVSDGRSFKGFLVLKNRN
ncbi:gliding motility-associated C-terminal domain-containing protein [Soonwooa buanensis]|uniref:Gliding motility-associated C-terminal domain-containing protein n=1 Tax=Soonwooa buanensis TaxID=619805 RepID=A0A1T5D3P8_9FLAO|nr:T9SS type B sorting domain-containing protein [Soonwooa buanensis]SKB66223.1 gliding motility-associated C-terminal domain-containing protein [Soonwooa buanensis]